MPEGVVPAAHSRSRLLPAIAWRTPKVTHDEWSNAPTPLRKSGISYEHVVTKAADRAHPRPLAEVPDDQADAQGDE
jgi:hypothetical protein